MTPGAGPEAARPTIVVVGLGPAGGDLVLPAAREALETADVVLARTARHAAVEDLRRTGLDVRDLDHHYEAAATLDAAYDAIVEEVVAAAHGGVRVAYCVPGNPGVAERTVGLLAEQAALPDAHFDLEVVPGLSFADLAWSRLGVDPLGGARLLDARSLDRSDVLAGGPALVAQCDSAALLSWVKLSLLEELPPAHPVTVLSRLGSRDESVRVVRLENLDREVEPDHLTSLFVDLGDGAGAEFARFVALVERLRAPGGCPWDAEQTHRSLSRHLLEEAHEVVEALDRLPAEAPARPADADRAFDESYRLVGEELGDLAAQVVFHATLARESGAFTVREVIRGIHDKLVRRHPHVFGTGEADSADDVMRNWEQLKRQEKAEQKGGQAGDDGEGSEGGASASLLGDETAGLPALLVAHKLFRQAEAGGLGLMDPASVGAALADAASRLEAADADESERLAGDVLAAVALYARHRGFDAEGALRRWTARFRARFREVEAIADERGVRLEDLEADEVTALWIEAAAGSGASGG